MNDDPQDDLARLRAEAAQGIASIVELARALGAFNRELREQGFTDSDALMLTATWLSESMRGSGDDDDD